jgi:Family of unknown function (DUF6506)
MHKRGHTQETQSRANEIKENVMALQRFGFIVTGAGYDPLRHVIRLDSPQFSTMVVGVPTAEQAVAVAKRMRVEGIQLIDLCGGFGPLGAARVIEALESAIPVGVVGYGPEAIDLLHKL